MSKRFWRVAIGALISLVTIAFVSGDVFAHTFLVRSSPEPGTRLTTAPHEVILDFTERVAADSTIAIRDGAGKAVGLLSVGPDNDRFRLRASLPELDEGVYTVTWHVVADDDHTTEGEFAFAVGVDVPADAAITNTSQSGRIMWLDALATLALLGGLAVALGGLLSERFVWAGTNQAGRAPAVTLAVLVGLLGSTIALGLALERAGRLDEPARWAGALTNRAERANLAIVVLLCCALLIIRRRRARPFAVVPVAIAGVLVALRGHAPDAPGWWATPATAAHLLVGGAWIGGLTHTATIARRNRATAESIEPGPSRYARAALVAAVTTLVIGVVCGRLRTHSVQRSRHHSLRTDPGPQDCRRRSRARCGASCPNSRHPRLRVTHREPGSLHDRRGCPAHRRPGRERVVVRHRARCGSRSCRARASTDAEANRVHSRPCRQPPRARRRSEGPPPHHCATARRTADSRTDVDLRRGRT